MKIEHCDKCNLGFNNNYKPINGIGNSINPKVMIVLESPKDKDIAENELFKSKHLNQLLFDLKIVNFSEKDIYITYLIKCRNHKANRSIDDIHLTICKQYISRELNYLNEGILILVGHKSINYILQGSFILIRDFGKILYGKKITILPIPSLSKLYGNDNAVSTYRKLLIKCYIWYKENIDANHKSIYDTSKN